MFGILVLSVLTDCALSSLVIQQTPLNLLINPEQRQAKIECYHGASDYPYMYWYQHKSAAGGQRTMDLIGRLEYGAPTLEKSFKSKFNITGHATAKAQLEISNVNPADTAQYFCAASRPDSGGYEAFFGGGTKLTVLEHDPIKPNVTVLAPSVNECKNKKDKKRKKTLVCVATEFYPDHVEVYWQMNEKNVTDGVATDEAAERIETPPVSYRITSRLRVSAKDWFTEGKKFTCIVSFYNGTATTKHRDTILGVEDKEDRGTGREKYLKITNKAKLSYTIFIFKSCLYGAFVGFLVWRLQSSPGKRKK